MAHLRARLRQRRHRIRGDPQPPWPTLSCDTGPSALAAAGYCCVRIRQDRTERSAIQRYGRARAQEPLRFQ